MIKALSDGSPNRIVHDFLSVVRMAHTRAQSQSWPRDTPSGGGGERVLCFNSHRKVTPETPNTPSKNNTVCPFKPRPRSLHLFPTPPTPAPITPGNSSVPIPHTSPTAKPTKNTNPVPSPANNQNGTLTSRF